MNKARTSITSLGLAVLFAACNSGSGSSPQGGSGGGSGGNQSNGSGGSQNGGSSGNPNGGSSSNASGGSSSAGGVTGKGGATGGGGTTSAGGATGKGGVTGAGGATSAGGATPSGGVTGKGGATGAGGATSAGGTTGAGGAPATGGTTSVTSTLVTSASGSYWKSGTWTEVTSTATVTVDDTKTSQTWEGFGGAFNELGWTYLTTKALQDQAMQLLFGTDGCHFAWGRIPMGASDYGTDRYTDDETANDTSMGSFSITRDQKNLIPYIKAAQGVKSDLRFWASPWTPPTWMKSSPYKTPGNPVNAFDGGTMKSDSAILAAYAQYYVKFVQGYKDQNINIEIVSPQNEPGYDQNYPSCLWDKTTYVNWVKALGPEMTKLGVKVMLGTLSNAGDNNRTDLDISAAVLADSTAKGIVTVVGAQWGVLDKVNGGQSFSGLPVWATEHKCGNYPWNPGGSIPAYKEPAPNDQAYGVESWGYIRDAITKGKVTAYNAWNMVLDKMGYGIDNTRKWAQDSLLFVDGGQITQTPAYYVFRHFAQFVDPGAKVVSASGGDAVGFKNSDGSIVAVMYNSGSANSSYVVSIGGKKFQFAMPGSGWATVKYKP